MPGCAGIAGTFAREMKLKPPGGGWLWMEASCQAGSPIRLGGVTGTAAVLVSCLTFALTLLWQAGGVRSQAVPWFEGALH